MATSNERCACCGFYIDACACKDTKFRDRIRELKHQLADCSAQSSSRQGLIMQYETRIETLTRQLAEARAERDRSLEGCARLHERYSESTQQTVNKLA